MQNFSRKRSLGVSLIELMVTVAVAAILLAVVAPGFQNLFQNNRMTSTTNELVSALNLARSEAVRTGANVRVCAIDGNWGNGWFVSRADNCAQANDNNIVRQWEAVHESVSIASAVNTLAFDGLGALVGNNASNITLSMGGTVANRVVSISAGGSIGAIKAGS